LTSEGNPDDTAMEKLSQETITILYFLLPGFVAAGIYHRFTPHRRTSELSERIIEAFILTGVVQVFVLAIKSLAVHIGEWHAFSPWTDNSTLAWGLLFAVPIGLTLAYCSNNDIPNKWLRELPYKDKWYVRLFRLKGKVLTKETTFPTEWCNAFNKDDDRFVVLHFKRDKLRMYAQLGEWPNYPDKGHFVLLMPEWLDSEGNSTPLEGVHKMLVPVEDVWIIEFMKTQAELDARKKQLKKQQGDPTISRETEEKSNGEELS